MSLDLGLPLPDIRGCSPFYQTFVSTLVAVVHDLPSLFYSFECSHVTEYLARTLLITFPGRCHPDPDGRC